MPRFKRTDYGLKFIPLDFSQQIVPGSFEHALCVLIDGGEVELSALQGRFHNDDCGAPAYHPGVLLKIVLAAYSPGIVSSRPIEAACRTNVLFVALSGDSCLHFTTLADFVAERGEEIKAIFTQVLMVCDRQGLFGREMSKGDLRNDTDWAQTGGFSTPSLGRKIELTRRTGAQSRVSRLARSCAYSPMTDGLWLRLAAVIASSGTRRSQDASRFPASRATK